MNVDTLPARVLRLSNLNGQELDPVTVVLMDNGPSSAAKGTYGGKLIVECYGRAWSAGFNSMRAQLADFVRTMPVQYLVGSLWPGISDRQFSASALVRRTRLEVIIRRRNRSLDQDQARYLYDGASSIGLYDSYEDLPKAERDLLRGLFGEKWSFYAADSTAPNPDYVYLTRIVQAIQAALAQPVVESAA